MHVLQAQYLYTTLTKHGCLNSLTYSKLQNSDSINYVFQRSLRKFLIQSTMQSSKSCLHFSKSYHQLSSSTTCCSPNKPS